jgi:hypothetical protein
LQAMSSKGTESHWHSAYHYPLSRRKNFNSSKEEGIRLVWHKRCCFMGISWHGFVSSL